MQAAANRHINLQAPPSAKSELRSQSHASQKTPRAFCDLISFFLNFNAIRGALYCILYMQALQGLRVAGFKGKNPIFRLPSKACV